MIRTQTFRRTLTAPVDNCAEMKSASSSGVASSGGVWGNVPESGATRHSALLQMALPMDLQVYGPAIACSFLRNNKQGLQYRSARKGRSASRPGCGRAMQAARNGGWVADKIKDKNGCNRFSWLLECAGHVFFFIRVHTRRCFYKRLE